MKVQITFFDEKNKFKPIARVVECESLEDYQQHKALYQKQAMLSICHTCRILPSEFIRQGYTKVKADTLENVENKKRARYLQYLYEKRQEV